MFLENIGMIDDELPQRRRPELQSLNALNQLSLLVLFFFFPISLLLPLLRASEWFVFLHAFTILTKFASLELQEQVSFFFVSNALSAKTRNHARNNKHLLLLRSLRSTTTRRSKKRNRYWSKFSSVLKVYAFFKHRAC